MIGADWSRHYWMFECTSATCGLMLFAHTPMVRAGRVFNSPGVVQLILNLFSTTTTD